MVVDGIKVIIVWIPSLSESGRNFLVRKDQIQHDACYVENERTEAGRDGRTCLMRPN